jgi:hypothetical protein
VYHVTEYDTEPKRVSKIFTCDISFPLLSVSTITATSTHLTSCLGWSPREGCLNIIETYTRLKLSLHINFNIVISNRGDIKHFLSQQMMHKLMFISKQGLDLRLALFQQIFNEANSIYIILYILVYVMVVELNNLLKMLLLLCGDVERNPGPEKITLMTQNCRGLQDYNKLRMLLRSKNAVLARGGAVLALQETHLMNDNMIKWSGNYVMSCSVSPHSAGCITFLNDYVRVIEVKQIDNHGHGHVIVVEGLTMHSTIIANIYAPVRSMGKEQEILYKELLKIVEELEQKYLFNKPNLIILGDFNLPLEPGGNHYSNDPEGRRAKALAGNFERKGLTDCWKNDDDRFTFKTAQSRLDRIMYRLDFDYCEQVETDWTFINSDHCLLKVILNPARGGPSYTRVVLLPTYLLENEEMLKMSKDKMAEMAAEAVNHWEPRVRLEYLKMCLRTVVGEVCKLFNNKTKVELERIQKKYKLENES